MLLSNVHSGPAMTGAHPRLQLRHSAEPARKTQTRPVRIKMRFGENDKVHSTLPSSCACVSVSFGTLLGPSPPAPPKHPALISYIFLSYMLVGTFVSKMSFKEKIYT